MPAPISTARAVAGREPLLLRGRSLGHLGVGEWPGAADISHSVHSARELRSSMFEIGVAGRPARLEELFEGFGEHDRLGLVMRRPCGAVGASALITAAITAFYDVQRSRGAGLLHLSRLLPLPRRRPARRPRAPRHLAAPQGGGGGGRSGADPGGDRRPRDHAPGRGGRAAGASGALEAETRGERPDADRHLPRLLGLGPRGAAPTCASRATP